MTKSLVLASLQNQSASSRIGAVNANYQMTTMDGDIIDDLINTMKNFICFIIVAFWTSFAIAQTKVEKTVRVKAGENISKSSLTLEMCI